MLRPAVLVCSPGVFHGFSEALSALPQRRHSIPWRRRGTCWTSILTALQPLSFDDINPTTLEQFSSELVAVAAPSRLGSAFLELPAMQVRSPVSQHPLRRECDTYCTVVKVYHTVVPWASWLCNDLFTCPLDQLRLSSSPSPSPIPVQHRPPDANQILAYPTVHTKSTRA